MECFAVSIMAIRLVAGVDCLNNRNIKFYTYKKIKKYTFWSEGSNNTEDKTKKNYRLPVGQVLRMKKKQQT